METIGRFLFSRFVVVLSEVGTHLEGHTHIDTDVDDACTGVHVYIITSTWSIYYVYVHVHVYFDIHAYIHMYVTMYMQMHMHCML